MHVSTEWRGGFPRLCPQAVWPRCFAWQTGVSMERYSLAV